MTLQVQGVTATCECSACNDPILAEFVTIRNPEHAKWAVDPWNRVFASGHRPKDVSGMTLMVKTDEYEIWGIDGGC